MQQPSPKKIVAVTGASGHVGANLVRALLAEGRHVRVLEYMDIAGYAGLDVEIIQGSVLDEKSVCQLMEGAEAVYHLAAKIYLGRKRDLETEHVNIIGPRLVAKACLEHQVKRLIYFSSIHALSPYPLNGVVDENRPLNTHKRSACYDRSKAAGEQEIYAAFRQGLNTVVVSPCAVIGPLDFKPSPMGQLLINLQKKSFFPLCKGGFNWVDVRDVVAGALAAEKQGRAGERYLLAGEWLSLTEIAAIIASYSSKRAFHIPLPVPLAQLGACLVEAWGDLTKTSSTFTLASVQTLQHYRYIDAGKAKQELGFRPRSIKQTILDTLDWYKKEGKII